MSNASSIRVFASRNVLLPGLDDPVPAIVHVDLSTGKIVKVAPEFHDTTHDPLGQQDHVDLGDKYLLPGLVEYVCRSSAPTIQAGDRSHHHSSNSTVLMFI
ncbi:uncharacterized protein EI90DRAFT_3047498 [Cantharellus anzutake]|uniref:uncharacterized protein n=1 Tax=Cantharellus anzutake TaxID=1750568 RepID=UPI0019062921|nr:uncharacterized protein EI90DRAFT_3047498 [Cantharellus anzutake]KAF8335906.1 hypothetical protein EI90DRAFT_3047498 [Cantharellus anzutake]